MVGFPNIGIGSTDGLEALDYLGAEGMDEMASPMLGRMGGAIVGFIYSEISCRR